MWDGIFTNLIQDGYRGNRSTLIQGGNATLIQGGVDPDEAYFIRAPCQYTIRYKAWIWWVEDDVVVCIVCGVVIVMMGEEGIVRMICVRMVVVYEGWVYLKGVRILMLYFRVRVKVRVAGVVV